MKKAVWWIAGCFALQITLLVLPVHAAVTPASERPVEAAPGVIVVRDIAYGEDPLQRFDVYLPSTKGHDAPVIFMVHGGGWWRGDKAHAGVVDNKVARWVTRGFILVSTNYRLVPQVTPLDQIDDLARALAVAQQQAGAWGGDPGGFILMGHSAGAHLVALLNTKPEVARARGVVPWLGTVSLDSAAINVVQEMEGPHAALYDDAFGSDPAFWAAASPYQQLDEAVAPMLLVCSAQRRTSCPRSYAFADKAQASGSRVSVLPVDLSHGQINGELGLESAYTVAVEDFLASLGPAVVERLQAPPLAQRFPHGPYRPYADPAGR